MSALFCSLNPFQQCLMKIHYSLFIIHYSLFIIHYSVNNLFL